MWKARKQAFGAIGRLASSLVTQDGVVPRTQIPQMYKTIMEIGKKYDIQIVNVFHAGDGNIHPVMLFDERDPSQTERVLKAGGEILQACLDAGGSVTGEHGIGVEKVKFMKQMFSEDDLDVMSALRSAFNPNNRLSPDKMLPTAGAVDMKKSTQQNGGDVEARSRPLNEISKVSDSIYQLPIIQTLEPSSAEELAAHVKQGFEQAMAMYPLGGPDIAALWIGTPNRRLGNFHRGRQSNR